MDLVLFYKKYKRILEIVHFICLFLAFIIVPGTTSCDHQPDSNKKKKNNTYLPIDCNENYCFDPNSSLTWSNNEKSTKNGNWNDANQYCYELKIIIDGYSEWRLPTIDELRTIIRRCPNTEKDGDCSVTSNCTELSCWNYNNCRCPDIAVTPDNCPYAPTISFSECPEFWSATPVTGKIDGYWSGYSKKWYWVAGFIMAQIEFIPAEIKKNIICVINN